MAPKKKKDSVREGYDEKEFEIVEINIDSTTPQLNIDGYEDFKLPMVEWPVCKKFNITLLFNWNQLWIFPYSFHIKYVLINPNS